MNSFRKNNVFVPINMTTISPNLLESELFGYEEGTFTGALKGGKLKTIPLRERKEDIEYLLKYFINLNLKDREIKSLKEFFQDETIDFLLNYQWIGNVRELINLVEYLMLIYDGQRLGMDSLHSYMLEAQVKEDAIYLSKDQIWVLRQFFYNDKAPLGRIKIAELAKINNIAIGEGKIRTIIKELNDYGFIEPIGTLGSKITKAGRDYINKLEP